MTEEHPRDDRAWPRGAFALSILFILAALGTGAGVMAAAADREPWVLATIGSTFVLTWCLTAIAYAAGMRPWIRGGRYSPGMQGFMLVVALVGVVFLIFVDAQFGGAVLAGLMGGMFTANAWAVRAARANRDAVDRAEAEIDLAHERRSVDSGWSAEPSEVAASATGPVAPVGQVLRHQVALERRRTLAWLVAGALVGLGCILVPGLSQERAVVAAGIVVGSAAVAVLWVTRRLWGSWLALRDFTRAAHVPRRAFVVLLNDPAPKMIRPLLAVWSKPPEPRGGHLPKPEVVYRADEELVELQSFQGDVVVHEAWVDTGPREQSKARWVAADAGISLPHRRALGGRWYVGALIRAERLGRPRALTMPSPRPDSAVPAEHTDVAGGFVPALAWRMLGLALVALLTVWIA